jgi:hypothetical protein
MFVLNHVRNSADPDDSVSPAGILTPECERYQIIPADAKDAPLPSKEPTA